MSENKEKWRSAAYFIVPDIEEATGYYKDKLGFSVDDWGSFAMVNRGGVTIMLNELKMGQKYPEMINPNRKRDHHAWDCYIWIYDQDLDTLYDELKGNGAIISHKPVKKSDYGMYELEVEDPFGYIICFGQDMFEEE